MSVWGRRRCLANFSPASMYVCTLVSLSLSFPAPYVHDNMCVKYFRVFFPVVGIYTGKVSETPQPVTVGLSSFRKSYFKACLPL